MEVNAQVTIRWRLGLHIRVATKIARLLTPFSSSVKFLKNDTVCDPRSVIQLLTLDAGIGDAVNIHAVGEDAQQAVETITCFFRDYLDDEEAMGSTY